MTDTAEKHKKIAAMMVSNRDFIVFSFRWYDQFSVALLFTKNFTLRSEKISALAYPG